MLKSITDWLEDRTGVVSALHHFLYEDIPDSAGWHQVLGSVALFAFLTQVVTGILLSFNYAPTPGDAYSSVRYIVLANAGRPCCSWRGRVGHRTDFKDVCNTSMAHGASSRNWSAPAGAAEQGSSIALSSDGNTALVGGNDDDRPHDLGGRRQGPDSGGAQLHGARSSISSRPRS